MNGFQTGLFPALFGVSLGQTSTATVSWFSVQGITGMVVVSSSGEVVSAAQPVQTATFPIATGTCYRGYALSGETVVGATDVVCAVPGQFAAPGTALDVAKIASGVTTVPR